jgi:hypothetical protein
LGDSALIDPKGLSTFLGENENWYQIELKETDGSGWVSKSYSTLNEITVNNESKMGEGIDNEDLQIKLLEEEIDFGLYYLLKNDKFILTTSLESIKSLIDRFNGEPVSETIPPEEDETSNEEEQPIEDPTTENETSESGEEASPEESSTTENETPEE